MVSTCDICHRSFKSLKGPRIHRSSREKKERVIINRHTEKTGLWMHGLDDWTLDAWMLGFWTIGL